MSATDIWVLEGELGIRPQMRIFVASKAAAYNFADGLPQHHEYPAAWGGREFQARRARLVRCRLQLVRVRPGALRSRGPADAHAALPLQSLPACARIRVRDE